MSKTKRKKSVINSIKITVPATSRNESFCRSLAASFVSQCDPTIEEIADVKTIISEAVTNCIVHAYKNENNEKNKQIYITCTLFDDNTFKCTVKDKGCGIPNLEKAMEPLFTTDAENERSGMGLPIMKTFSDTLRVTTKAGEGTKVIFTKKIGATNGSEN